MPKQKEQKETVTYPPSKRKPPPFKPLRPSKLQRTATTESERSDTTCKAPSAAAREKAASKTKAPAEKATVPTKRSTISKTTPQVAELISDTDDSDASSDDLPDVSMLASTAAQPKRHIDDALLNVLTDDDVDAVPKDASPPDIEDDATIPQPLLLRLMHEHFESKDTKIDKHAVVVLQKYLDVFVRETIARAALSKKDDVENGKASQSDVDWLDRQDLEKVAGGMLMDF